MILANLLTKVQGIEEIIQKLGQIGSSKQKKGRVSLLVKVTYSKWLVLRVWSRVIVCFREHSWDPW